MKRLFSAISSFSEESEVIIKRARLLISALSSSSPPRDISQRTSLSSSNSENVLIIISDSEDDRSNSFSIDENEPELIDLTEDDIFSNSHEHQSSIDTEYCPICLEYLSHLQSHHIDLFITPCHHVLCKLCSRQLLLTSSSCPLCRQNISASTLMPYCILT